jgi:AcrR family transcriptional regulator
MLATLLEDGVAMTGPGGRKRRDPRAEAAHAATLAAATDLLLERGPQAVTIEAVAARAGVAKTTIYRRWSGRGELLIDVLRRFPLGLEPPDPALPPGERLRLVARQLAAALRQPVWRRVLPLLAGGGDLRDELAPFRDRIDAHQARVVSTVIADAVRAGALPADTDVREALLQLLGPIAIAALMTPEAADDAFADRMVDLLLASRSGSSKTAGTPSGG